MREAHPRRLGYIEAHLDAERRLENGERQKWCPACGKWQWDDEPCCGVRRLTQREFDREAEKHA